LPTVCISSIACSKNSNEIPILEVSRSGEFSADLSGSVDLAIEGDQANRPELPLFNFNCVVVATNKLGEGGFGRVYKVSIFLS